MAKFHINSETGNPGVCTAKIQCPFGDLEADHYPSPDTAREAYEVKMKNKELIAVQKDDKEIASKANDFSNGNFTLGSFPMEFVPYEDETGRVEGSRWMAVDIHNTRARGGDLPELSVHNGKARVTLWSTRLQRNAIVHEAKLDNDAQEFEDSTQAARFLTEAEDKINNYKWD